LKFVRQEYLKRGYQGHYAIAYDKELWKQAVIGNILKMNVVLNIDGREFSLNQ